MNVGSRRTAHAWAAVLASAAVFAAIANSANAAFSYTTAGNLYSQNFDSLASTGTANTWANDTTLPGWFLFRQPAASPVALTTYRASNGSDTTGAFYSFGTTAADRALGGIGSNGSAGSYFNTVAAGSPAGWIAFGVTNNTGGNLTSFTFNYDGEQWRDGGHSTGTTPSVQQTMIVQYGFGASFGAVPSWQAAGSGFNFASPVFGATSAAGVTLNGNLAANRVAGLGGTINATWAPGTTLFIRFVELNDVNNDHALAIDNFTFSAVGVAPVPEPATVAASFAALAVGFAALRFRRRAR
jgi:hypothetical protein